ncbi:MAG TPA: hypothetical protein VFV00_04455 [Acidimicrobiales bacterium]|nr:hypothetical protein [Acidimicrobiales bacterium]
MKPAAFEFDRSWTFTVPRDSLWSRLSDTSSFSTWWPWLRSFDPVPIEEGARTRCTIGPPLPYVLTVDLTVARVVEFETVDVDVDGDLRGPARLQLGDGDGGTTARLHWTLDVQRPMLRRAAMLGRPVLQWGHDWVVRSGVEQFRATLAAERR